MLRSGPQTAISHVQTELLRGVEEREEKRGRIFVRANAESWVSFTLITLDNVTCRLAFLTPSTRTETRMLIISAVSLSEFPNHLRSSIKHCA